MRPRQPHVTAADTFNMLAFRPCAHGRTRPQLHPVPPTINLAVPDRPFLAGSPPSHSRRALRETGWSRQERDL